jgi:hypothetical protein
MLSPSPGARPLIAAFYSSPFFQVRVGGGGNRWGREVLLNGKASSLLFYSIPCFR